MSERGVFAVDRGIWEHPVFADEKFSEREAFLWLVGEASYKARRVRVGSNILELKRGQVGHSLRFMAGKWKWTEPRVRRFLARLKNDAMIDAATDAGQTVITICNYDKYQRVSLPSDAPSDAAPDAGATQQRRKEEYKEYKEDISSSLRSEDTELDLRADDASWHDDLFGQPAAFVPAKIEKPKPDPRGSYINPDWVPSDSAWQKALDELGSKDRAARELEKFRNYWLSKSGKDGRKRDWNAAFRTWIMNAVDYDAKRQGSNNSRTGQSAFRQSGPTGVDAVAAALAERKARRAQSMGGGDLEGRQDCRDNPGIVDADWSDAVGS